MVETIYNISRVDIENSLSKENVRIPMIIYFTFFLGVLLFLLITLFLYSQNTTDAEQTVYQTETLNLFGVILFILTVGAIAVSIFVPKIFISTSKLISEIKSNNLNSSSDIIGFFSSKLRILLILRAAPIEGAALFGVVAFFISVTDGSIYYNNIYWLFLVPALFFLAYIVLNFPTKNQQIEMIEKYFINSIKTYSM